MCRQLGRVVGGSTCRCTALTFLIKYVSTSYDRGIDRYQLLTTHSCYRQHYLQGNRAFSLAAHTVDEGVGGEEGEGEGEGEGDQKSKFCSIL